MRRARRSIGLLVIAALLAPLWIMPGSTSAQSAGPVLDQQVIEVDGMRPIGLSPDGNLLAATDFGQRGLCVYTLDPLEEQACADLEPLEARLRIEDVVWSPDSTRLVMAENVFQLFRDGDLWVMDAATGELTNLTDDGYQGNIPIFDDEAEGELFLDVSPAWTPDGSEVTFARTRWADGNFQGTQIMSVPADGGEAAELILVDMVEPGIVYYRMQWSADGEFLYYTVTHQSRDDFRNGIYRFSRADGGIRGIVPSDPDLGSPALVQVSPAGDALIGIYPMTMVNFGTDGHWFYDLETEELSILTAPDGDEDPIAVAAAATFAPDGRSILLGVRGAEGAGTLWELSRDDLSPELIADDLPGIAVMQFGMTLSWTESGRIFIPATIGIGTLLEVAPREVLSSTPDAMASPEAEASPFSPGDTVVVSSDGVPLHAAPSDLAPAVLLVNPETVLTVIGPPEEVDGVVWVPVQDKETRTIGYVRAKQLIA